MEQNPLNELEALQEQASHELEEGFTALAEVLTDFEIEQDSEPNTLLLKKGQKEKHANEIAQELIGFKHMLENGAKCFDEILKRFAKERPEKDVKNVSVDLAKLGFYFITFEEHAEEFDMAMEEDKTIQELVGIRPATLKLLYEAAALLYEEARFSDAASCFAILTFLNPHEPLFWLGLGNAEYYCQHYEKALMTYAFVVQVNPDDPTPHLFSSKCYEELQDIDNAINALDLALYVIRDEENQEQLKKQI